MEILHIKVSELDLIEYPCAIYTLSYQDGVIHAWERFLQNYNTGEYNIPNYIESVCKNYDEIVKKSRGTGNYWDMAYYEGYTNGVIMIKACDSNPDAIIEFPFFFLPPMREDNMPFEIYIEELKKLSNSRSKYVRYAKRIVGESYENGIVVHHPPY